MHECNMEIVPERYLSAIIALANCCLRVGALKSANAFYYLVLKIRKEFIENWDAFVNGKTAENLNSTHGIMKLKQNLIWNIPSRFKE